MQINIRPAGANALGNLRASNGVKLINLIWTLPINDPSYRAAQIWVNTVNDRETATLVETVAGNVFSYRVTDTATRYFWIRSVNEYGRTDGPFTGPASAQAQLVTSSDLADAVFDLNSAKVVGQLAAGKVTGLGALALLNSVGITNISGLGQLATKDAIAADAIGAGILAAGVVYAGIVNANQVSAASLSAITGIIGLLRSRADGGRVEIQNDIIAVYATNNANRVLIGNTG